MLAHLLQHEVAARERGLRCGVRIVAGGGANQPGEERALRQRDVFGALAEERLGGGLDPVRALAEVDRVQVKAEDLRLRVLVLQLPGQSCFVELPLQRSPADDQGVLDVLLRDRGSAFHDSALRGVVKERADDRLEVDAGMGEEARVLDRHDRVLDVLGNLLDRDDVAVLLFVEGRDQRAVGGEDLRGLGQARGVREGLLEIGQPHARRRRQRERRRSGGEPDPSREQGSHHPVGPSSWVFGPFGDGSGEPRRLPGGTMPPAMGADAREQLRILASGASAIIPEDEFAKRLERSVSTGVPMRIKLGIDPSSPDIHLGHAVPLRKLRRSRTSVTPRF